MSDGRVNGQRSAISGARARWGCKQSAGCESVAGRAGEGSAWEWSC